jgi:hypothetical protein
MNDFYFEYRIMTPRTLPDLVDIEQELFELPQKVRASLFTLLLNTHIVYTTRNASFITKKFRRPFLRQSHRQIMNRSSDNGFNARGT